MGSCFAGTTEGGIKNGRLIGRPFLFFNSGVAHA